MLIHRRVLTRQADTLTNLAGFGQQIRTGHGGGAVVGCNQGGQDRHGGGLARPIGPE